MNKLILLALLGCIAISLAGAAEEKENDQLAQINSQVEQFRVAREAEAGKGKKSQKKKKQKKVKKSSKKGKKSARKGKKKNGKSKKAKGKKNNKKNNKKNKKKNKKNKKKNKKNKKKTKKNKNKKKAKKSRKSTSSRQTCSVSFTCVERAALLMKLVKDKVNNFNNQLKRIERQNSTAAKKEGKMDNFKPLLVQIVSAGGGNKSALTCGSSSTNAGAKTLQSLVASLDECADKIKASCGQSKLSPPDPKLTAACSKSMDSFASEVTKCTEKTGAEACTCFESETISTLEKEIRACDLSKNATVFATSTGDCQAAYGDCKKLQDGVGGALHACSIDPAAALSKLKSLTENDASVTKALEKVKALSARKIRSVRQVATCASVITSVDSLTTLIDQNPSSPSIKSLADTVAGATVTCSAEEKAKLKTAGSALETAKASIADDIAAVKATIKELTGSEPSDADIAAAPTCAPTGCDTSAAATTAAATVTTVAPAGRRKRLAVEEILRNNIL